MLPTIPWGCMALAVPAIWLLLFPLDPPPPLAPPEGCGTPATEATGERCPGAEVQEDPRTGLCPGEEGLCLPPHLQPPPAGTPLPSKTCGSRI